MVNIIKNMENTTAVSRYETAVENKARLRFTGKLGIREQLYPS